MRLKIQNPNQSKKKDWKSKIQNSKSKPEIDIDNSGLLVIWILDLGFKKR